MCCFLLFKGKVTKSHYKWTWNVVSDDKSKCCLGESLFIWRFISQAPLLKLIYPDLINVKSFANIVDLAGIYLCVCACVSAFPSELNVWKMNWVLFVCTKIIPLTRSTSRLWQAWSSSGNQNGAGAQRWNLASCHQLCRGSSGTGAGPLRNHLCSASSYVRCSSAACKRWPLAKDDSLRNLCICHYFTQLSLGIWNRRIAVLFLAGCVLGQGLELHLHCHVTAPCKWSVLSKH